VKRTHYYVACPNVLGVRTSEPGIKWSFGTAMPPVSSREFDNCQVRLCVDVVDEVLIPESNRSGKYHYWLGSDSDDAIFYDRAFCFGARLRMAIQGLCGSEFHLQVNRNYFRYVSHRFMNLHSVGYILTDLASLLLLRNGFAPLHCSAFRHGNATVVVAAAPNTGKTLTSMMACLEHQADFIAEDLAITDGCNVFSIPWTSTFRYYKQINQHWATKWKNQVTQVLPLLELLGSHRPTPITEYVSMERIVDRSPATHVILLERGARQRRPIGVEEAFHRVRNLNRYEFYYSKAPAAVAYEYFNPQLNLNAACQTEETLIRKLLQNVQVWGIRSNNPTEYAGMIIEALQEPAAKSAPLLAVA
jgi:hypothetical protein